MNIIIGFVALGAVFLLYAEMRWSMHKMNSRIGELESCGKGKRPSYIVRSGLEDICSNEIAEDQDFVAAQMHIREAQKLMDMSRSIRQERINIEKDLRNGEYDPDAPIKKYQKREGQS
jgi:hypothetical protein